MERKRKHLLPYLIVALFAFYAGHWLFKLYLNAPEVIDPLNPFSKYGWVIDNLETKHWLDFDFTPHSLVAGRVGFVYPY